MQNRKGVTLIEFFVVVVIVLFVILGGIAANFGKYNTKLTRTMRMICGANLKGMARGLSIYAHDNDGKYPVQGGGDHVWGEATTGWDDPGKDWDSDGEMTVSSSLYLLVRYTDVEVKSFICKESKQTVFVNSTKHGMVQIWDFGDEPSDHQSYAYQFPYGKFAGSEATNPGNAILADRNPWFDKTLTATTIDKQTADTFMETVSLIDFLEGAAGWKTKVGNSSLHDRQGQNVLFGDGHVDYCKRSDVGTGGDNIYTIAGDSQEKRRKGISPTNKRIDSTGEEDSLLINDM